jgi:antirestriction protein ArdC
MAKKSQDEIRKELTKKIVEALDKNTIPWRQPWSNATNQGMPCNFYSGRRYTGINPVVLYWHTLFGNYSSKNWGTGNSWMKNLGGIIRKGEKAAYVVLWQTIPEKDKKTGEIKKDKDGKNKFIWWLKEFPVFNVEQIDAPDVQKLLDGRGRGGIVGAMLGELNSRKTVTTQAELMTIARKFLPASMVPDARSTREQIAEAIHNGINKRLDKYRSVLPEQNQEPDFAPAEALISASKANIKHGCSKAYYSPSTDSIGMPTKRSFKSMTHYYQTMMHELAHWAEAKHRLGKKEDASYAFCELVADMSACFVLAELGVPATNSVLPQTEAYVKSWIKDMNSDPKYIFEAATKAGKVADHLLAFVGKQNSDFVSEEPEPSTEVERHQEAA